MGIFDLKGGSASWNYHDESKAGYMTSITGTVVEISNPQARDYNTGKPKFWDDGNPVRNLCITVRGQSGKEVAWFFSPKSVAADACLKALDPDDARESVSIEELLGKNVTISTKPGAYNAKHPRPWAVVVNGDGDQSAVRGLKDLSQQQATQHDAQSTALEASQQKAAEALGFQPAQQNAQPQGADPTGGYYDEDIPF